MNDLIEHVHRREATADELVKLEGWRAAHAANEQQYRDVMRILDAAACLRAEIAIAPVPRLATVLGQDPARSPSHGASRRVRSASFQRRGWRHVPWSIAAAAVLLLIANVTRTLMREGDVPLQRAEVVTGPGEIVTVQLGEGSVVRLAPNSRLRLGEDGTARSVSLDGQAFFSIARMADQPFMVRTRAATATVLGTRFEIGTRGEDLRLLVVEGRVALETPANRVEVGAGEMSAVTGRTATFPTRIDDAQALLRWTGQFLAFQATPLGDAAREIAAVYGVDIVLADPELSQQTVTAVFTGQDLNAVLEVMCEIVNAQCLVRASEVIISPR